MSIEDVSCEDQRFLQRSQSFTSPTLSAIYIYIHHHHSSYIERSFRGYLFANRLRSHRFCLYISLQLHLRIFIYLLLSYRIGVTSH